MIYSRCTAGVLLGGLAFLCFAQAPPKKGRSDVKKQAFGKMPDGTAVDLYTLSNARGMQAEIATYGGAVVSLTAPDRAGKFADVVMGMENLEGYREQTYYLRRARRTVRQPHCPRQIHAGRQELRNAPE